MPRTSDAVRDANLLGAAGLAVSERLSTSNDDAALVAIAAFLEGERIEALAESLGVSHSGAVRVVDRLVAAGHVERSAGPDGRSVSLRLTASGRTAAALLAARREARMLELLAGMTGEERAALRRGLERILTVITDDGAPPSHTCRLCDTVACGHPERCPVTIAAAG